MSALLDALYSLGGGILDVLDMPGSYTRGALAGRFGDRLSGRDMLEEWGLLDANQEGFDAGDVAGFAADVVVDPLNFLGGAGLLGGARKASKIRKANNASDALRASGAIPEEVLALSKVQDPVFHGTKSRDIFPWDLDPARVGTNTNDSGWYGAGVYWSPEKEFAETFMPNKGTLPEMSAEIYRKQFGLEGVPDEIIQHHSPFLARAEEAEYQRLRELEPWNMEPAEKLSHDEALAMAEKLAAQADAELSLLNRPHGKLIDAHVDIRNPAYVKYGDPYFVDEFGDMIPGPGGYIEVPRQLSKSNSLGVEISKNLKELGYDGVIAQGNHPEIVTFSKDQSYLPFVAPRLQEVPRTQSALLAAILGYNTLNLAG